MQFQNRRLIRVGKSSLAVILPKPWLDYYGLEYGDSIEVYSNRRIVIKPPSKGDSK